MREEAIEAAALLLRVACVHDHQRIDTSIVVPARGHAIRSVVVEAGEIDLGVRSADQIGDHAPRVARVFAADARAAIGVERLRPRQSDPWMHGAGRLVAPERGLRVVVAHAALAAKEGRIEGFRSPVVGMCFVGELDEKNERAARQRTGSQHRPIEPLPEGPARGRLGQRPDSRPRRRGGRDRGKCGQDKRYENSLGGSHGLRPGASRRS